MDGPPQLPRHKLWQAEYRAHRYARHLSHEELCERARDIFLNLLQVTPDAKIAIFPTTPRVPLFAEVWTHVLEELRLRNISYRDAMSSELHNLKQVPEFVGALAQKAASALSTRGLASAEVFIRYSKRKYMEALLDRGSIRIQPATAYLSGTHNAAVRDDERALGMSFALSRADVLSLVRNPQDVPSEMPEQRVDVQFQSPTNYWMLCGSRSLEPRLFVDFEADACVIIRNVAEFRSRLRAATEATLHAEMREGPVVYVDPLLPSSVRPSLCFSKHFRFAYQEEYRFVWIPRQATQKLEYVDVEVGALRDIAELIAI
jgi:hypothetical protein